MMKKNIILFIIFLSYLNLPAQKYTAKYIKDDNALALEWLNNIDNTNYKLSYQMLDIKLKKKYSEENWINEMNRLMNEFGNIKDRELQETSFRSEIEDLEDGFYVIIEYLSDYKNTKNHSEFLIIKQNDNMQWKILDYYYEFENKKDSYLIKIK